MKTDVRAIKRINGTYTALSKSQSNLKNLCDFCGKQKVCKVFSANKRNSKITLSKSIVTDCQSYMFPILFRDTTGTDGKGFNTFRLGKAWSKRVKKGDVVAIIDKADEVVGHAEVLDVIVGDKFVMAKKYARGNHLMLNRKEEDYEGAFHKILRNNYGNLIYKNNDEATVIVLSRID